jgi:hypothetical protein
VAKEKGHMILCRECPGPRRKEKKKLNKNLEFPGALSTR